MCGTSSLASKCLLVLGVEKAAARVEMTVGRWSNVVCGNRIFWGMYSSACSVAPSALTQDVEESWLEYNPKNTVASFKHR